MGRPNQCNPAMGRRRAGNGSGWGDKNAYHWLLHRRRRNHTRIARPAGWFRGLGFLCQGCRSDPFARRGKSTTIGVGILEMTKDVSTGVRLLVDQRVRAKALPSERRSSGPTPARHVFMICVGAIAFEKPVPNAVVAIERHRATG